ncbi:HAD domain-containing protein [Streptomyces hainanensis]|uniref:Secreted protein n=1 Tax=Streptomyces hainanensis TaxID=402648 RepID=A0A4R4T0J6_9ACTN|nr:HAD domain-containing protein [Streptomyces hainanensis]TDC70281.1 hypothetical protein E1283_24910 [Streptomyces hainanensis]
MPRPLLYLDVDGPLNPYAADPQRPPAGYTAHRMLPESWLAQHLGKPRPYVKPLRVLLNPEHGKQLRTLSARYDLVWATAWSTEANTFIAPVLGLPDLPAVEFPAEDATHLNGRCWKTRHILAHAAGRAFAWIDDEIGDADLKHVRSHHPSSALLHHVDARIGLQDEDFATLRGFAQQFTTPSSPAAPRRGNHPQL